MKKIMLLLILTITLIGCDTHYRFKYYIDQIGEYNFKNDSLIVSAGTVDFAHIDGGYLLIQCKTNNACTLYPDKIVGMKENYGRMQAKYNKGETLNPIDTVINSTHMIQYLPSNVKEREIKIHIYLEYLFEVSKNDTIKIFTKGALVNNKNESLLPDSLLLILPDKLY